MTARHTVTPAVWMFVENEKRQLLLIRRANTGWRDGWYTVPAGHVEPYESPLESAVRELKEEVGLTAQIADIELAHTSYYVADSGDHERVSFFISVKSHSGVATNNEPEKADDLIWVGYNALPENLIPILKHAIEQIKLNKSYSEFGYQKSDTIK